MPDNVEFFEADAGSVVIEGNVTRLRLSESWIDGLSKAVAYAPENAALFPEIAETPEDVIAWMLFGKRREHHADYMAARRIR